MHAGALVLVFLYPLAPMAAPSNLEQARQGLEKLIERRGAFRIELDWQGPVPGQPENTSSQTMRGVFDGERHQIEFEQKGIPGKTGPLAAKKSIYCYDGEKSIWYLDHEDAQDSFYIGKNSNKQIVELYRLSSAKDFLAGKNLKELEPTEICGAACVGFEETIDSSQYGLRQVRRFWLDPGNGWLPLRTEQLVYTLKQDPPGLSDFWVYTATRVGLNESGVPFAAEVAQDWNYGNESGTRTVVCKHFETGIAVTDDMFTMEPPPGAEVLDEIAGLRYTAGETGAVDDVLEDIEPAGEEAEPPGSAATAEEAGSVPINRTSTPRSAIFPSGWPLFFGLGAAFALLAGLWVLHRYMRRTRGD